MMKLDIGCGKNKKVGYTGIDCYQVEGVDVVIDLNNQELPYPNDSIDEIYTSHFLEHVNHPEKLLSEISKKLINNGNLIIIVPHYSNPYSVTPLHKTYWNSFSLNQNYIDYYISNELVLIEKSIRFVGYPLSDWLSKFFTKYNTFYEWILSPIIKAYEIKFILKKVSGRKVETYL